MEISLRPVKRPSKKTEVNICRRKGQKVVNSKNFTIEYQHVSDVWQWIEKQIPPISGPVNPFEKPSVVAITVRSRKKDGSGKWRFFDSRTQTVYGYTFVEVLRFLTK